MSEGLTLPRHLYVHVPLCRSKCRYCDFYSLPEGAFAPESLVVDTMLSAVDWIRRGLAQAPLETLYIGGGTPSMLGLHLPLLVRELGMLFGLAEGAEVTVEANPDSLDAALVSRLAEVGVTRVSLGVQSLSEAALAWLGRAHDASQAIDAMLAVAESGLDLSVDLMCGIPAVSPALWRASLASVVECGATHVSVYPLCVEPGTPLSASVEAGEEPLPEPDAAADEMETASQVLGELGLRRYETANYAMPGKESRHNTAYWTGRPYLGIGAGAHGMLTAAQAAAGGLSVPNDAGRVRYSYEPGGEMVVEALTQAEAMREDAMLGMRMAEGISDSLASAAGVTRELEKLEVAGLVVHDAGRWRSTDRGWLLGNEIFGRIWGAEDA
jgi:oxygen-independent coproporphyrinogen-3 oxidase